MKSIDIIPVVSIISLVLYFFVAAQGAFYLFGFGKALYNVPVENFIELRKQVDPVVRGRFKVLYLSSITMMFIWLMLTDKSEGFLSYAFILGAFLLLAADLFLIIKVSEPVNNTINGDISQMIESWNELRHQWLKFIMIRGSLSVSGFVLLLLHLVLGIR